LAIINRQWPGSRYREVVLTLTPLRMKGPGVITFISAFRKNSERLDEW
jgi:hypothetical protein